MNGEKNLNIEKRLDEAIIAQNDKLAELEPGTKEYDSVVDAMTKLTNLKNETKKNKINNWTQVFKVAADVGLGIASLIVLIWGTKASFKFEETGTITSGVGRKLQDKLMNVFTIFKR